MKKYKILPEMPEVFFYKGYKEKWPKIYNSTVEEDFIEICRVECIQNGLLQLNRRSKGNHIIGEWGNLCVSVELMQKFVQDKILEKDRFIPVAYGFWAQTEPEYIVPLPDFYLMNLDRNTKTDHIYINMKDKPIKRLYVSEDVLKIILEFENPGLEYEEVEDS